MRRSSWRSSSSIQWPNTAAASGSASIDRLVASFWKHLLDLFLFVRRAASCISRCVCALFLSNTFTGSPANVRQRLRIQVAEADSIGSTYDKPRCVLCLPLQTYDKIGRRTVVEAGGWFTGCSKVCALVRWWPQFTRHKSRAKVVVHPWWSFKLLYLAEVCGRRDSMLIGSLWLKTAVSGTHSGQWSAAREFATTRRPEECRLQPACELVATSGGWW